LTALALFAAYVTFTGIDGINIFKANVLAALFIGAMIPVVFSALAMSSVGKAAMDMVKEVRRQFKEIPGIMEGTGKPEYAKCVAISTKAVLREMLLPGLITIATPILVGLLMGAEPLGAYMAGVTVSGVLWAIFQNNAGGAWDNAKKSFEKGVEIDGQMYYKKSEPHKAAVTGDTVGDPFKDTSGPSMNILIKLTSLVGLTIAPLLADQSHFSHKNSTEPIAVEVTANSNAALLATALSLPSGYSMNVNENGIEAGLLNFISNKDSIVIKTTWFDFDRLTFLTNSSELESTSNEQLDNIAKILNEFPLVKVKIGGYTDNVGAADANLKLSGSRADFVKMALIKRGIAADRMESEGYGQEHPIAANDTEEGRQQNRRISMRVTAK
jgi:K(+)-stimulated pyrophosphate-energized sodium pump